MVITFGIVHRLIQTQDVHLASRRRRTRSRCVHVAEVNVWPRFLPFSLDAVIRSDQADDQVDSNLQVWRNAHDAKSRFDDAWIREFVTNSIVINKPRPMAKNMVYIMHECALAEVKCTHTDGEQQGMLEVAMATEHSIPGRSTTKTFFRFEQDAKRSLVSESAVCFPVDVTFNKKDGFFQVLKSITMRTV